MTYIDIDGTQDVVDGWQVVVVGRQIAVDID